MIILFFVNGTCLIFYQIRVKYLQKVNFGVCIAPTSLYFSPQMMKTCYVALKSLIIIKIKNLFFNLLQSCEKNLFKSFNFVNLEHIFDYRVPRVPNFFSKE